MGPNMTMTTATTTRRKGRLLAAAAAALPEIMATMLLPNKGGCTSTPSAAASTASSSAFTSRCCCLRDDRNTNPTTRRRRHCGVFGGCGGGGGGGAGGVAVTAHLRRFAPLTRGRMIPPSTFPPPPLSSLPSLSSLPLNGKKRRPNGDLDDDVDTESEDGIDAGFNPERSKKGGGGSKTYDDDEKYTDPRERSSASSPTTTTTTKTKTKTKTMTTTTTASERRTRDRNCTARRAGTTTTTIRRKRRNRPPPYSESAYNLSNDERRLRYNFISFIDQSIGSKYSQVVRMVEPRKYARHDQFSSGMSDVPPTIDDVAPPPSSYGQLGQFLAWNKLPARILVGAMSYAAFPHVTAALKLATKDINQEHFSILVNSTFLPGISIILGTYFSLTLSILYNRKARIQETAASEAALLALTCRNMLDLFGTDETSAIEGAQCVADQIRTMVRDSRGREVMAVIYDDPYARILDLVNNGRMRRRRRKEEGRFNDDDDDDDDWNVDLANDVRHAVGELYHLRTRRMSDESLALAPTHFDVMTFLSGLLLFGFALGAVAMKTESIPARILFAFLVASYTIFYEMSFDLNRPFDGVYQVRTCTISAYFLQTKHLISTHPIVGGGRVDFEPPGSVGVADTSEGEEDDVDDCDAACRKQKDDTWFY